MKKLLLILIPFLLYGQSIIDASGTQYYFTAGIPGKDSAVEAEPAGTQFYFTAGIMGGDSLGPSCTPPTIEYTTPPVCTAYVPFSQNATLAGGTCDSVTTDGLPEGLSLNATTGAVTGTPLSDSVKTAYRVIAWGCDNDTTFDTLTVVYPRSIRVLVIGQSNAIGKGVAPGTYATANNANCKLWGWQDSIVAPIVEPANYGNPWPGDQTVGGSILVSLANTIQGATPDTSVTIITSPKGATNLYGGAAEWSATGPGSLFQLSVDRALAAHGCDYVVWYQGESDAYNSVTEAQYLTALNTLAGRYRTALSNANLPFIAIPIGWYSEGNTCGAIRSAISNFDDGVKNFCTPPAAALLDSNLHLSINSLKTIGGWAGDVVNRLRGMGGNRSPKLAASSLSLDRKTITIRCATAGRGPLVGGTTGFRVYASGAEKTVTSHTINDTAITLSVDTALAGQVIVDYLYANAMVGTDAIYDSDSLPLDAFRDTVNRTGWDNDSCAFVIAPAAWAKGNGKTNKQTGNLPSYPLAAGKNVVLTNFAAGYGYVYNADTGYLRCRAADLNYLPINLPHTYTTTSNETFEIKFNFVASASAQTLFGAGIDNSNYWQASINASTRKPQLLFSVGGVVKYVRGTAALADGLHTMQFRKKSDGTMDMVIDGTKIVAYDTKENYTQADFALTTQHSIGAVKITAGYVGYSNSNIYWLAVYNKFLSDATCTTNHALGNDMGLYGYNTGDTLDLLDTPRRSGNLFRKSRTLTIIGD